MEQTKIAVRVFYSSPVVFAFVFHGGAVFLLIQSELLSDNVRNNTVFGI